MHVLFDWLYKCLWPCSLLVSHSPIELSRGALEHMQGSFLLHLLAFIPYGHQMIKCALLDRGKNPNSDVAEACLVAKRYILRLKSPASKMRDTVDSLALSLKL